VPRYDRSAVDRNKVKRRLRELVRLDLLPTLRRSLPHDLLLRARADAYNVEFAALRDAVRSVVARIGPPSPSIDPPAESETRE
jgi:ribonuclease P protein component